MSLEQQVDWLEEKIEQVEQVARLSARLRGELPETEPFPADLDTVRGKLRSARDLAKHNQRQVAEALLREAEEALQAVQQRLAVNDLSISPFALRTFLEKNQLSRDLLVVLIRYLLGKQPHADNDRDKLDYLLTAYLTPSPGEEGTTTATEFEPLRQALEGVFAGLGRKDPLGGPAEMMIHELESLIARVEEFDDFDKLVQARMVERVRALKTNLGEEFYHPRVLASVIRFNDAFRQHFEKLFHCQLSHVRSETRRLIDHASEAVGAIHAAHERLSRAADKAVAAAALPEEEPAAYLGPRVRPPFELVDERLPLDRLVGHGQEKQKEQELRGIVSRLGRFVEKLPPERAAAETVGFPLRRGQLELHRWEREAFAPAATKAAPESTRAVQYALGVIAWMEEELAHYRETRDDRYVWKAHLDLLSYAASRALDLLTTMRGLLREETPPGEAAWFDSLRQTAQRLGSVLNRVTPVFDDPGTP